MGLKVEGAKLLLKGGLLNRTNYIAALADAATEFTNTGNYARIAIALAAWTLTNAGAAENTAAANFPSPSAVLQDPMYMGMYDSQAVGSGNLLLTTAFAGNPEPPGIGAPFGFDAGQIDLGRTAASKVIGRGQRAAFEEGLVSGTRYFSVHSAEPGDQGGSQIDDSVLVAASLWDFTASMEQEVQNNASIAFGVQASDEARPTWTALRDGAGAGANVLWKDELDEQALDPDVGATITILANMVTIGFTID